MPKSKKPNYKKRPEEKPELVRHNDVIIEEKHYLSWIEYLGYVLHDEDLSLRDADSEIVEILKDIERELRENADKQDVEWRHVWGKPEQESYFIIDEDCA